MKYAAASLLLTLCLCAPALAQTPVQGRELQALTRPSDGQAPARPVHITDDLVSSPEGQEALRAFHAAKAAGLLPRRKTTASTCTVGETKSFNVLTNLLSSGSTWVAKDFQCQAANAIANVWVETSQLGVVPEDDIAALDNALLTSTPEGSFNPDQGIIANDNEVFGAPPNFDGDGITDVLIYDVDEGPDAEDGTFVLGFFSPTDINPNAPAGQGNQADILYLDTDPLITDPGRFGRDQTFVQLTAAHEYQHLIHANYDLLESSFVNEAQSEWAEYMNGYQGRFITYLNDPAEHNRSFFNFDDGGGLIDRQRGSLFHNYLAEQKGVLMTGSITRDPGRNQVGYEDVFGAATLKDLLADFHTANFLNNPTLDPRFGYQRDRLQGIRATPAAEVDGRSANETPPVQFSLNKGGVRYLTWEDVGDFTLNVDAVDDGTASIGTLRSWLRPRVVLERTDGTVEVVSAPAQAEAQTFTGPFARVTLIVAHIELGDIAAPVLFSYSASWTASSAGLTAVAFEFDDGNIHANDANGNGQLFFSGADADGAFANRFLVPEGAVALDKVWIAPFFDNQFSGSTQPPGAPRDVAVTVWSDNAGLPGDELFSTDVNLGTGYFAIDLSCDLSNPCPITNFAEVDLSAHANELSDLPPVIHVGYKETGTDTNYLVVAPSLYTVENVSAIVLSNGAWTPLWNVSLSNGASLTNASIPIRAEFLVDTATPVETADELPERVTLEANYPNPFNPVTTIAYGLDRAAEVRLAVYDVLGRRVATLVEGLMPAGRHAAVFDAAGQASGLYFYTLETPARKLTRTMLLLK